MPATDVSTPTRRLPSLDGVRGVAILLVVMHNMSLLTQPQDLAGHAVAFWFDRGWTGVQLFFVLSGFLITSILLDTRNNADYFKSFFMRRVLRIFPLYYATLLLMFVLLPAMHVWHGLSLSEYPHQLWVTVFLSNWTQPFHVGQGSMPHMWSLAVEEQFYLIWPLIVYRWDANRIFKLSLMLALVAFVIRCVLLSTLNEPLAEEAVHEFSVCRMDALALGAAAAAALRMTHWREALIQRQTQLLWIGVAALLVGAGCSHGYLQTAPSNQIFGFALLSVGFSLCVLFAACADIEGTSRWTSVLRNPLLQRFGLYSYGMYLLHVPLREVVIFPLLRWTGLEDHSSAWLALVVIAFGTAASFGVGAASYHLFEIHFLRLKRYFGVSSSKPSP